MACYGTQTGKKRHPYHYYVCSARRANKSSCQVRQGFRAEEAEGEVWRLVRGLMTDPERLRAGLDAYLEAERAKAAPGGDPAQEAKAWATKLKEADRKRGALLAGYAHTAPERLDALTPEQRTNSTGRWACASWPDPTA